MKSPKEYYRLYLADDNLSELNKDLIEEVLKEKPQHVLEFGSGTGKNLKYLQALDREISVKGIDVSYINTIHAVVKNNLDHVSLGDETDLRHMCNYDVIFTVSVLDHIEDIRAIMHEFKRIANKAIVIAECIEQDYANYYYRHEYEKYGFTKIRGLDRVSEGDNRQYQVFKWKKYGEDSNNKGAQDDLAN